MAVVPPLPPVTVAHPVLPSADCCHCMVPVYPLTVMVVLLAEQIVAAVAVAVPPTEVGLTVIVASPELTAEQGLLCTTARYFVVAVRFVAVSVEVVLAISADEDQLSVEYCHLVTLPVFPDNVRVVLFVPVHTVALPAMVPPTEVGLTLMVTFCVKEAVQFGVALVTVMPVICSVCPLLAAVSAAEVKLAAPELLAITPVTGVCAVPLME